MSISQTARTKLNKAAHKGVNDQETLYAIIDESKMAHVAIHDHRGPTVIPMLVWRIDDNLYIHGAKNSPLMKHLRKGEDCCLTFTLFDGWVLARSAFHHSAHYRCAMVFGCFERIESNQQKSDALDAFLEQIAPGRSLEARPGNEKELTATELLVMPIQETSVKVGRHGVNDDLADMKLDVWAGVLPYRTVVGPLIDAPDLETTTKPDYSSAYGKRWSDE
ncbi:pyridoxamine 5'-phosphate oxidase family protein [Enterovibrio sp. ZSDZ35]|uniref:Pyridoxamine 5'-phosphate oxidase family protein n=1 Tax=Enterovibrio qingdaonensis TaxID=2899818 RepID=A0ABT5QGM5_9GAMM|nr:pyridoxamine 5'-phosphate oxidase family protein [Enterovibrio sp. ZSDZ35]MDD1780132.1 pyridoxamine 5'-phosphate oxidase family protein [Enterovibrio sp. ZSDZ35]